MRRSPPWLRSICDANRLADLNQDATSSCPTRCVKILEPSLKLRGVHTSSHETVCTMTVRSRAHVAALKFPHIHFSVVLHAALIEISHVLKHRVLKPELSSSLSRNPTLWISNLTSLVTTGHHLKMTVRSGHRITNRKNNTSVRHESLDSCRYI